MINLDHKRLVYLLILCFVLVSAPTLYAEDQIFEVSEDLLTSIEEKEGETEEDVEPLKDFQMNEEIDFENIDFSIFDNKVSIIDNEKGKVIGHYTILPTDLMKLSLYLNNNPQIDRLEGKGSNKTHFKVNDKYTFEVESELLDGLKLFYGYDTSQENKQAENQLSSFDHESNLIAQNAGVEINPLPGFIVNADYKKFLESGGLDKNQKSVNVAYKADSFATINAGIGVISEEVEAYDLQLLSNMLGQMEKRIEEENMVVTQMGLALHPNDYSQLSADYVSMNEKGSDNKLFSTIFGFKLGDDQKELNARYQLDNQKNITNILKSTLDLGLNFSVNDNSSFKFLYKWITPEEDKIESEDKNDETRAEAQLEIRF